MNKSNKSNSAKLILPITLNKNNEIQQNCQIINNNSLNNSIEESIITIRVDEKSQCIIFKKKHYKKESFEEYSLKLNQSLAQ